jgi:DNA-binding NtrC family response regulator
MQKKDWRELATRASAEQDPDKLLEIIQELNELLEIRERRERNLRKETSGRRILLVDDEDNIRLTLSLILRERGFAVTAAGSVLDAKRILKVQDFDVLLCDLNIEHEGDGFEVLQAMGEVNPKCVSIFITAYPALETAHRAIQHDIDGYVSKPADIEELVALLERKLAARHACIGVTRAEEARVNTGQSEH